MVYGSYIDFQYNYSLVAWGALDSMYMACKVQLIFDKDQIAQ